MGGLCCQGMFVIRKAAIVFKFKLWHIDLLDDPSLLEQLDTNPVAPPRQPKRPCGTYGLRLRPSNARVIYMT